MARGGKRPGSGRPKGSATKLSLRERRFIDSYVVTLNATKAAIAAGFAAKSAGTWGAKLLKKAGVQAILEKRMEELAEKAGVSAQRVIEEFARVAFSDVRKAVRWRSNVKTAAIDEETGKPITVVTNEVTLLDSDKLDDAVAAAIHSISQGPKGDLKIRFHNKIAALTELGKHLGLFKTDPTDSDGVTIEIRRLSKQRDDADDDD